MGQSPESDTCKRFPVCVCVCSCSRRLSLSGSETRPGAKQTDSMANVLHFKEANWEMMKDSAVSPHHSDKPDAVTDHHKDECIKNVWANKMCLRGEESIAQYRSTFICVPPRPHVQTENNQFSASVRTAKG